MSRPDPQPSDWLLRSRYSADRVLTTRAKRSPFTVRYDDGSLVVTTLAGGPRPIEPTDFANDWSKLAANPSSQGKQAQATGSYVQAIYDDLHQPVDQRDRDRTYSVYVIELDEGAWADDDMQSGIRNPTCPSPASTSATPANRSGPDSRSI